MAVRVAVAYVAPGVELLIPLELPDGASVQDAVAAARIGERTGANVDTSVCAIFGRRVAPGTRLADGDRVEITRPLVCDPRTARRARVRRRA
jgi:putative ubiquitin-RnfH superfamily antitoxin RatB of RatAB toxin-antitoxin module